MIQKKQVFLRFIIALFMMLWVGQLCFAKESGDISKNPHVLFLSSYSYEWESTPKQLRGIEETLNGCATIDYVFMDTKRLDYDSVKDDIYSDIEQRQRTEGYDYVIAADDAALTFVLEYRKALFEGVPVVFEGINSEEFAREAVADALITGIVETFPLDDTIALAAALCPDARRVVGISDDTQSGRGSTQQFMDSQQNFPNLVFETLDCSLFTCEEIGETVAGYGGDTILVYLMMSHDAQGNTYSNTEAVEYVTSCATIPVYKADELGIGKGIMGGVVVSYEDMAADAAQMVLDIENGRDISRIPLQTAESYTMFDKEVLDAFEIDKMQVEAAAENEITYVNNPPGFFEEHKRVLLPSAIIVLLLLLIIFGGIYLLKAQKNLTVEIKKKDLMLENLLDNIPGGVAIYQIPLSSINGIKTIYSSEGVPKLTGRTMNEYLKWIEGDLFDNTVYAEDLPQLKQIVADCVPEGKPINVQYRIRHKDGSLVWVMLSAVLISNEKNECIYYAVYTDITQHKKLQQAEKKEMEAMLASQAKSQFLSTVSHDMRTPLNGILGLTELMLEKGVDGQTREDLLQLKNSGQYLLALINDTLDISKIESGNLELHPTVCEGRRVFDNVVSLLKPILENKSIRLKTNIQELPHTKLYVDIGRIEQIVMNVIGNAVKFSPRGAVIEFTMENLSVEDGVIMDKVTIVDYGIGMSEEFLPYIFEPFQQEHCGSKTKYQGTGLGMSITKKLLELLGGEIWVESKLGEGTKVTFTLPMQIATPEQITAAKRKNDCAVAVGSRLSGKRILLCEDHPLNAAIAMRLLEKCGCQVIHVENGQEGLQCFLDSDVGYFDAVLMDIRMPVMDGLEATRAIRGQSRADAAVVPIIAMSANAFDEDVQKSLEAGMNAHLAKPIEPDKFFRCILIEIDRREAGCNEKD